MWRLHFLFSISNYLHGKIIRFVDLLLWSFIKCHKTAKTTHRRKNIYTKKTRKKKKNWICSLDRTFSAKMIHSHNAIVYYWLTALLRLHSKILFIKWFGFDFTQFHFIWDVVVVVLFCLYLFALAFVWRNWLQTYVCVSVSVIFVIMFICWTWHEIKIRSLELESMWRHSSSCN